MPLDINEELVGAYLAEVSGCDYVVYNVRPKGGGIRGLDELDVIGLDFDHRKAYVCEVKTHLHGLRFGRGSGGTAGVRKKFEKQVRYADDHLRRFPHRVFMFWSPYVAEGHLTRELEAIEGLELIINREYTRRIDQLIAEARGAERSTNNSAFRLLQIIEHLRRDPYADRERDTAESGEG